MVLKYKRAGQIWSIGLQKGGVGKTTTVVLLANEISIMYPNLKILAIDFDPQGNLTESLADLKDADEVRGYDIFRCLLGEAEIEKVILPISDNLDLLPSHEDLSVLPQQIMKQLIEGKLGTDIFFLLKDLLEQIREQYDYIIIDLPPERGYLATLGLVASDGVIPVMQAEPYARRAVPKFLETVENVKKEYNPNLKVLGILCTMADNRTNMSAEVIKSLRMAYLDLVFDTAIKRTVRLQEASLIGESRKAKEIRESYGQLVLELVERGLIKIDSDIK